MFYIEGLNDMETILQDIRETTPWFGLVDIDARRRLLLCGLRERNRQDAVFERSFDLLRL